MEVVCGVERTVCVNGRLGAYSGDTPSIPLHILFAVCFSF